MGGALTIDASILTPRARDTGGGVRRMWDLVAAGRYPVATRVRDPAKAVENSRVERRFGTEESEAWRAAAFGEGGFKSSRPDHKSQKHSEIRLLMASAVIDRPGGLNQLWRCRVNPDLVDAIAIKRLVEFVYEFGRSRIVEPHEYGIRGSVESLYSRG
jgi:hypothetical protein